MSDATYTPAQVSTLAVLIKTAVQGGLFSPDAGRAMVRALRAGTAVQQVQEPDRLLTTAQVANRLALSKKSVLRMAKSGALSCTHIRPGVAKSLRFRSSDVSTIVASTVTSQENHADE